MFKKIKLLYYKSNRLIGMFNKCSQKLLTELCKSFCATFSCLYFWTQHNKPHFLIFELHTTTYLQFAYKSRISTIHCVNSVYETINHYVSNSSAVYVCKLDASKAFDRVNLLALFEKLHKRSMCPLFLRFLMHSYFNQKMRIN